MLSDYNTIEWLKRNRKNILGEIDLKGLDFGGEHINFNNIKAKSISNIQQEATWIDNSDQTAEDWIINANQEAKEEIWNSKQKTKGFINNGGQDATKIFN